MLSEIDKDRIINLCRKNGYSFSVHDLIRLTRQHKKAAQSGDVLTMERIEYRLTWCNFHAEACLMHDGFYNDLISILKEGK